MVRLFPSLAAKGLIVMAPSCVNSLYPSAEESWEEMTKIEPRNKMLYSPGSVRSSWSPKFCNAKINYTTGKLIRKQFCNATRCPQGMLCQQGKRLPQKPGNHPNFEKNALGVKRPFSEQLSEFRGILGAILGMALTTYFM